MTTKTTLALLVALLGCTSASAPAPTPAPAVAPAPAKRGAFAESFDVDPADWASVGANTYFILEPGYRLEFAGKDHGKPVALVIVVLDETKTIDGVETRVVEERETAGGVPTEISRNYFAFSKRDGGVYYFGEDVDEYEHGEVVGHGGSWHAGENGARFGLMMPGAPTVGARFYQEHAPGVAMDRSEIVSVSETFETPAGKFENCLKVKETSALEKSKEHKLYAPGVGLVRDAEFKLVRHGSRAK